MSSGFDPIQLIYEFISQLQVYKNNFTTQVGASFDRLTLQDAIRLVIIAGAYALLRPYLIKLGGKFQAQDHERDIDQDEIEEMRKAEGYNKGQYAKVSIPEDTDSEDDGADGATKKTGTDWGKTARRRQRRVMRTLLEAEEKRRREEEEAESDKELEQFMIG